MTSRPLSNSENEEEEDEASPSMLRSAEDNLSNSEGPLISAKRRDIDQHRLLSPARNQMQSTAMLLQQETNNWHKSCSCPGDDCESDLKKGHRCIWMLTAVLTFIGCCNVMLSMSILVVLRISQGMEALEVMHDEDLVKFFGNTDLDKVCLENGIFEGFGDEPIELIGDAGGVHIQVSNRQYGKLTGSNLQVLRNGTSVSQVKSFQVKDPRSGSPIFSTDFPNFGLPQGVKHIELDVTQTHRIAAPKKSDLLIRSDGNAYLHGAEGMSLDSKDIIWTAKNDVFLHSRNGDIVVDAKDGINLPRIPITSASAFLPSQSNEMKGQYKVCVCMPDGKLFLVSSHGSNGKVNCAKISRSLDNDPCISS